MKKYLPLALPIIALTMMLGLMILFIYQNHFRVANQGTQVIDTILTLPLDSCTVDKMLDNDVAATFYYGCYKIHINHQPYIPYEHPARYDIGIRDYQGQLVFCNLLSSNYYQSDVDRLLKYLRTKHPF